MRRTVPLLVIFLLASASLLQAQSKDERAIRALLDRSLQAANSVDPKVVQAIWAEYARTGGPFYAPFGNPLASTAEVQAFSNEMLAQLAARSSQVTSPISVRVDKNLAWAVYTWRTEATFKDGTRRGFDGRATVAFIREGKNWKIAHWHSSVPAALPPTATALNAEAQRIIQIERDAWEALRSKDLAAIGTYFAEDVSIFEYDQAYRIQGKAEVLRGIETWLADSTIRTYQILDPKVQVLGDTAILSYYFTDAVVTGGREMPHSGKLTVVFVKQGGAWKALHEHVSLNR